MVLGSTKIRLRSAYILNSSLAQGDAAVPEKTCQARNSSCNAVQRGFGGGSNVHGAPSGVEKSFQVVGLFPHRSNRGERVFSQENS